MCTAQDHLPLKMDPSRWGVLEWVMLVALSVAGMYLLNGFLTLLDKGTRVSHSISGVSTWS